MDNRKTTWDDVSGESLKKKTDTSTSTPWKRRNRDRDRDRDQTDCSGGGGGDFNKSSIGRPETPCPSPIETGRNGRRPRKDIKSCVSKVMVKPTPKTPEEELREAKVNYIMITETVVKAVEKSIRVFEKLGVPERRYTQNGHNLSYGNGIMHPEFSAKTLKVQESLKQLRLTVDENCSSIFAHRFFILAVYEYPQHAYPIALTLQNFFKTSPGQLHRNILVVTYLKKFMVAVLNRTTIYDYFLDPRRSTSVIVTEDQTKPATPSDLEQLEEYFPKLKPIRANQGTLQKKIAERHLNTATFIGYLICMLCENGSETFLMDILRHLSFNIDSMNFFATSRITQICCHLIPHYNNVTSKLLSRLSHFYESVGSDDLNVFKYRCMLWEMFENLVMTRDIEIRDQEKIWEQVGDTEKYKKYSDYQRHLLKEARRAEKALKKMSMSMEDDENDEDDDSPEKSPKIIITKGKGNEKGTGASGRSITLLKSVAGKLRRSGFKNFDLPDDEREKQRRAWEFGFETRRDCRIVEELMKINPNTNRNEMEEDWDLELEGQEQLCDEEEPFYDAMAMDMEVDHEETVQNVENVEKEIFHDVDVDIVESVQEENEKQEDVSLEINEADNDIFQEMEEEERRAFECLERIVAEIEEGEIVEDENESDTKKSEILVDDIDGGNKDCENQHTTTTTPDHAGTTVTCCGQSLEKDEDDQIHKSEDKLVDKKNTRGKRKHKNKTQKLKRSKYSK